MIRSQLDEQQILQSVYDPADDRLRVDASIDNVTIIAGALEVSTTYQTDSMAIGDPASNNILAINPDGSINVVGTITGSSDVNIHDSSGANILLGQKTMALSVPVVIASDQSAIPVSQSGVWSVGRTWTLSSGTDSVNVGNFPASVSVTQGTSPWVVSGTVTVNQGTSPWVTSASQSGTWTVQQGTPPWSVVGNVASGSADSGNPVKIGGVFNTVLPTFTTGQRADLQLDSNGRLIISPTSVSGTVTVSNFPTTVDTNYGTVGASTIRTAAQIGNATGAADFGAGTTTTQTLRVVLPTDQTAVPATQSGTWNSGIIGRTDNTLIGNDLDSLKTLLPTRWDSILFNQTITADGVASVELDAGPWKDIVFNFRILGPVTGTSPTISFQASDLDQASSNIVFQTDLGTYTTSSIGFTRFHFTRTGRIQLNWQVTGTSPSFGGVYVSAVAQNGSAVLRDFDGIQQGTVTAPLFVSGVLTGTSSMNVAQWGGVATSLGQKVMASSVPVVIASNQSAVPVSQSGTWTVQQGTAPWSFNETQINGVTISTGNGVAGTGVQRVTIASDNTAFSVNAIQSGTWNINNISGTISLPTGASTSANQTTEITSLQILDDVPSAQNAAFVKGNPVMGQLDDTSTVVATEDNVAVVRITAQRGLHINLRNNAGTEIGTSTTPVRIDPTGTTTQPVSGTITANQGTSPWVTNVTQFGSSAVVTGTGASGAGIPRVTVSNDSNILATQSGSWTVTANAGTNLNTSALALDTSVNGILVTQGSTTSGEKGPLVQGAVTTAAPSYTNAQTSPLSLDTSGSLRVTGVTSAGAKITYSASLISLVSAALATDIFTITGSATKTVKVLRTGISGISTSGVEAQIRLIKRSTANTGGTSTAQTAVPHDSNNAAATATVLAYTANPTLGTSIGAIRAGRLSTPTAGGVGDAQIVEWSFGENSGQPVILNGTSQVLAWNLAGVTISGGSFEFYIEWTEE